ncbi:Double-stranded RNA-binding protein 4 [Capsicum annuum]|nr:Double-stranded RNA-binding protein 4 [Capsicum annuum]KAF3655379.1 Double-stranded RNA-binding protein 4 [Capsicum annuum]
MRTAHEGTTDVNDSKVDMLTTQYETFTMKEGETIQEMHTRFTSITNEFHCLGEVILLYKQVRKILGVLPKSWESKVYAITEARNLKTLTIEELIVNLKTHELKKHQPLTLLHSGIRVSPLHMCEPSQPRCLRLVLSYLVPDIFISNPTSPGMLHLYKNRLQHYAQKQNLTLPVYSSVLDGPPHTRRFRSKVTVDGETYETQEFFSTLKEAEHAAAKVAFESLALNDIQEDEGLYKTLLQELAQKEGFLFPVYDTARTGPPHAPIFRSMVEVGGGTFQGQEAKTKKQAEMNAAKVAYNALVKRGRLDEHLQVLPASSGCAAADVSQLVIQQKTKLIIEELSLQNEEADKNAKRHRCSTAPNTYSLSRDRCPAASSSASPIFDHSTDTVADSADSGKYAGTSILPGEKIFIFPRNANLELPNGASVLPCSDEKWVAASLESNRNQ